jgi:hypothetical protein
MLSDWIDAIAAELPGFPLHLGAEHIYRHDRMPGSIVFIPTDDQYEGEPGRGGFRPGDDPAQAFTCHAGVVAHIWQVGDVSVKNDDFRQCERLRNRLINAVRRAAPGAFDVGAGAWEDKQGGTDFNLGRVYMQRFTLHIPVTEEAADASSTGVVLTTVEPQVLGEDQPGVQPVSVEPAAP